jgi:hypothetical protein
METADWLAYLLTGFSVPEKDSYKLSFDCFLVDFGGFLC